MGRLSILNMKKIFRNLIIVIIVGYITIAFSVGVVEATNNIFQNGMNVGIGTTSPTGMFSVQVPPFATPAAVPPSLLQVVNQRFPQQF